MATSARNSRNRPPLTPEALESAILAALSRCETTAGGLRYLSLPKVAVRDRDAALAELLARGEIESYPFQPKYGQAEVRYRLTPFAGVACDQDRKPIRFRRTRPPGD